MHKGDLPAAEKNLRHSLQIDPHSMAALNNLGIVLAGENRPAEAIPFYLQALKVRPGDVTTERNLAVAYFKARRYRSAWSLLQPLSAANPSDFQILDLAAFSLFALDRYADAAQYLERANQADPSDMETLEFLGKAYLRLKNYKALPSVFERMMKINPNSASAHVMMGIAYDKSSDLENATKEYQAAEQADPKLMGVHSGLGYLYWRQGQAADAEKEMRAELANYPSDPIANCILAQILFNNSALEDARTHFEQALQADPRYTDALLGLGKTQVALKHPEKALAPLRKAIAIDPNSAEAHFVLGTALKQTGRAAEAVREQKTSIDLQNKKHTADAEAAEKK